MRARDQSKWRGALKLKIQGAGGRTMILLHRELKSDEKTGTGTAMEGALTVEKRLTLTVIQPLKTVVS